ncbi:MAG: hypothetical protein EXS64_17995 [Candidatus Latescibacteria bacterium]|nr:hypothetical protein [Candidatus Latescibacterota bacterium]
MNLETYRTDFLFASPSFLQGMASIFDFGGFLLVFNQSRTPEEANEKAMRADWAMVGKDIQDALKKYSLAQT